MLNLEDTYKQFGERVFNISLQYLRNVEDAEEVTQDVFLTVYNKQSQFEGKAQLGTWIHRIAVNKSLILSRRGTDKNGAGFAVVSHRDHRNVAQPNNDRNHLGVALEHRELVSKWFHRIDQLPENQRTAIVLVRIEEFSLAEAAAIMNLSVKAVDSLLQRAKKNLLKIELKTRGNEKPTSIVPVDTHFGSVTNTNTMEMNDPLHPSVHIGRVSPSPFLFTRIQAKVDAMKEVPQSLGWVSWTSIAVGLCLIFLWKCAQFAADFLR